MKTLDLQEKIGQYKTRIEDGDLQIPIDSISITSFLQVNFPLLAAAGMRLDFQHENSNGLIIKELEKFGVSTLKELDNIVPEKFESVYLDNLGKVLWRSSCSGLLRNIMMCNDIVKYFKDSWKKENWSVINSDSLPVLEIYCPNVREILKEKNVKSDWGVL